MLDEIADATVTTRSSTTVTHNIEVDVEFFRDHPDGAFGEASVGAAIERVESMPGHEATTWPNPALHAWIFEFSGEEWLNVDFLRRYVILRLNARKE